MSRWCVHHGSRDGFVRMKAVAVLLLCVFSIKADSPTPTTLPALAQVVRFNLDNGLRVALIRLREAETFAAFTYLAGGLAADEPEHVLWTRLIERICTQPIGFSDGEARADHVRIETWGWPEQWEAVLDEHARVVRNADCTDESLKAYQEDTISYSLWAESQHVWWHTVIALSVQGWLYGRHNIDIEEDMLRVTDPATLLAYRRRHWDQIEDRLLVVVGNQEETALKPMITRLFGSSDVPQPASRPAPAASTSQAVVTTSLRRAYVVLSWPVTDVSLAERAALACVSEYLRSEWNRPFHVRREPGPFVVSSRVFLPTGIAFVAAMQLSHEDDPELARRYLLERFRILSREPITEKQLGTVRDRLIKATKRPVEVLYIEPYLEPKEVIQAHIDYARYSADNEWFMGADAGALHDELAAVTPERIRAVARRFLSIDKCRVCVLRPRASE